MIIQCKTYFFLESSFIHCLGDRHFLFIDVLIFFFFFFLPQLNFLRYCILNKFEHSNVSVGDVLLFSDKVVYDSMSLYANLFKSLCNFSEHE